jgi:hypothetical protein
MRCRWRRQADEIIEVKQRLVIFPDLVDFVEKEARIANNPIFGNISERPKAWPAKGKSNEVSKSRQANYKGSRFATEMQGTRGANNSSSRKVDKSCEELIMFRRTNHVLEECDILRCKPYKERIGFLMERDFALVVYERVISQRIVWIELHAKLPIVFESIPQSFIPILTIFKRTESTREALRKKTKALRLKVSKKLMLDPLPVTTTSNVLP